MFFSFLSFTGAYLFFNCYTNMICSCVTINNSSMLVKFKLKL